MILAAPERIADYTARGWWGTSPIDDVFRAGVAAHPDRLAVVDPPNRADFTDGAPRRLTWAELGDEVGRLAAVLHFAGLRRDDVVAAQLPNLAEYTALYLACFRLGIIVTPVPLQFREHELNHVVSHTGARAAVTRTRIGKHAHAAMWLALRQHLPTLDRVLVFGGDVPDGATGLDAAMAGSTPIATPAPGITGNDIATICWTSGTEAQPKGVPRSHNEWLVIAPSIIESANLQPGARLLTPSPYVNMAALSVNLATWVVIGGTLVHHHPMSLPTMLQQWRDEQVDYCVLPAAVLNKLLQEPEQLAGIDFRRLRMIGSGGAPLSEWMVRGFHERFGVSIINHFGSNEGAALSSPPADIPDAAARASFYPRAGVPGFNWSVSTLAKIRTRLVDVETGADIDEVGRAGELRFKGPTIFAGYWNAPEMTARAFDDQGYYRTGDLFEIAGDSKQFYRYTGRAKDLVIRGGMNISSEEIEALVLGHPDVAEAAVVGWPDAIMGEKVCVFVAPRPGATVTLPDLVRFLKEEKRVAMYKLPEHLVLIDVLPRNPVGKILKRELRERVKALAEPGPAAA